jgi:hypothetical protein
MTEQNNNEVVSSEVVSSEVVSSEVVSSEVVSSEVVSSEVVSSELAENEQTVPLEWVGKPVFAPNIYWLSNKILARERRKGTREFLEMLEENGLLDIFSLPKILDGEISKEEFIKEVMSEEETVTYTEPYPGWFTNFTVDEISDIPTFEETKTTVKNILKSWNLTSSLDGVGVMPTPIWLSKSDRKKLIQEFDQSSALEPEVLDNGYRHGHALRFLKIFNETTALGVDILTTLAYPPFSTTVRAKNDPIRTMVGKACIFRKQPALNSSKDDWEILGQGVLSYDDQFLTVGDFVMNTPDRDMVIFGRAFSLVIWPNHNEDNFYYLEVQPEEHPFSRIQSSNPKTSDTKENNND